MNIHQNDGSYIYTLRVEGKSCLFIGVRSLSIVREGVKILSFIKSSPLNLCDG
jgi:hypothetical protein